MKKQVEEWLKRAEIDLLSAEKLLTEEYLTPSTAFHTHQAIEKSFKAIFEDRGKRIPRVHDLELLYAKIQKMGITFRGIDENILLEVNEVYIDSRYPCEVGLMPYGLPSLEKVKEFYILAKKIYKQIVKKLNT
ncbi:HEPN domain-containing protein [Desulfonauticus submarinus]